MAETSNDMFLKATCLFKLLNAFEASKRKIASATKYS